MALMFAVAEPPTVSVAAFTVLPLSRFKMAPATVVLPTVMLPPAVVRSDKSSEPPFKVTPVPGVSM